MADLHHNPLKTTGFEFVEFTGNVELLEKLFANMGFQQVGAHKDLDIRLYRQGNISFLLNAEKSGQAADFSKEHGSGANAMGFVVDNRRYRRQ